MLCAEKLSLCFSFIEKMEREKRVKNFRWRCATFLQTLQTFPWACGEERGTSVGWDITGWDPGGGVQWGRMEGGLSRQCSLQPSSVTARCGTAALSRDSFERK